MYNEKQKKNAQDHYINNLRFHEELGNKKATPLLIMIEKELKSERKEEFIFYLCKIHGTEGMHNAFCVTNYFNR